MSPPNEERRPAGRCGNGAPDDVRPGGHNVSIRIARLRPDDRERLLDRLGELRDLDRLARERGLLAEVGP
jgi:hypothetical protein